MRPNVSTVRFTAASTCCAVAHVTGHGQRLAALGAHRRGHAFQRLRAPAADGDVRADPGHLDGDGAPDALAGARHQGHAVAQRVGRKAH